LCHTLISGDDDDDDAGWIFTKNCARVEVIFSLLSVVAPVEKLQLQVTKPVISSRVNKEHLGTLSSPQELRSP
jgi:hypothetical protein